MGAFGDRRVFYRQLSTLYTQKKIGSNDKIRSNSNQIGQKKYTNRRVFLFVPRLFATKKTIPNDLIYSTPKNQGKKGVYSIFKFARCRRTDVSLRPPSKQICTRGIRHRANQGRRVQHRYRYAATQASPYCRVSTPFVLGFWV